MNKLMSLTDPKDTLRSYYIRQLRRSGWNAGTQPRTGTGGWVTCPDGRQVQGWHHVIQRLAASMDRFAAAMRTSGCTCHEDKGAARGPQHGLGCRLYRPQVYPVPMAGRTVLVTVPEDEPDAWVIRCRVSGGVTGTREALAKGTDGKVQIFPTREAAEAVAATYRGSMGRHSLASFSYTVEPAFGELGW